MKNWNNDLTDKMELLKGIRENYGNLLIMKDTKVFKMLYNELEDRLYTTVLDKLILELDLK